MSGILKGGEKSKLPMIDPDDYIAVILIPAEGETDIKLRHVEDTEDRRGFMRSVGEFLLELGADLIKESKGD